jgi:ATP-dependent DNA helicase DinG
MLDAENILGPQGRIAARLKNYEYRPQQLQMANAVSAALRSHRHLIAEAGTGVGKSFAYLVPAILEVTEEADGRPRRIVISTHTISLQEQLLQKDIPFLNAIIPREFTTVLVKGRANYVSLRRLKVAAEKARQLFQDVYELEQIADLVAWSKQTTDGSLTDLPSRPPANVWSEVVSDSDNCFGRKCPTHAECFYYQARRRVQNAHILVVNHALFFSDLALRQHGYGVLPRYDAVIFDEAHTIEAVAGEHMGISITSSQVQFALNKVYNERTQKGLLALPHFVRLQELVTRCHIKAYEVFGDLSEIATKSHGGTMRVRTPSLPIQNELSPALLELASDLEREAVHIDDENEKQSFTAAAVRMRALATSLTTWLQHLLPETVYWIESTTGRRGLRVQLAAAPIDVGPALREQLFDQTKSVIMTSATLSVGREAEFTFFKSRLGVTSCSTVRLGSPFNYREQARLILLEGRPDPQNQRAEYEQASMEMIQRYVQLTDGRAFVLFTSYDMLRKCAQALTPWLASHNFALLSQADGIPRSKMLETFRSQPRSVLFGTDSFWQGVDVPGDALQNVIITKLPFSVPDQPLVQARMEAIREAGRNPFLEYLLPEAIIKLRQGFGRLIRTQRDKGIVVILDPRVHTKSYGGLVLESLPECDVVVAKYIP